MTDVPNHWQLYTGPGYPRARQISDTLDMELDQILQRLDRMVASGVPVRLATNQAFNAMVKNTLDLPQFAHYGAADSEGRDYLASQFEYHIRDKHKVDYKVDRWGGVS